MPEADFLSLSSRFVLGPEGRHRLRVSQSLLALVAYVLFALCQQIEVRFGLIEARAVQVRDVPMVVRIVGTNAAEAATAAAARKRDRKRSGPPRSPGR